MVKYSLYIYIQNCTLCILYKLTKEIVIDGKKEVKTDLWVYDLLKDAEIELDPQGSSIKEIDDALKTASKKGTGHVGFPEYVGVVKDFIIVIEDKPKTDKHVFWMVVLSV